MTVVNVRLRQRTSNKNRKLLSTKENVYLSATELIGASLPYEPGASCADGEWFYIDDAMTQTYTKGLLDRGFDTVDFGLLRKSEFPSIDYLFVYVGNDIYFQKVSRSRLIAQKTIQLFGDEYIYQSDREEIVVNDIPDAIYVSGEDRLYFKRLEAITSIFKGIDELYREATETEVENFLKSPFISIRGDYGTSHVKTPNRKKIALAIQILSEKTVAEQKKIFSYIEKYGKDLNLKRKNGAFEIGNENELKLLLSGIEQRFYTTPVGGEKRLANSSVPLAKFHRP